MALLLQLRTRTQNNSFRNPSLIHLFSTSSSNSNSNDDEPDSSASDDRASSNSHSHFSSYFSDVKKVLKQHQSSSPSSTIRNPSTPSFTASGSGTQRVSQAASIEEIRKNLSSFRSRYSEKNPTPSASSAPSSSNISFQELYERNVTAKPVDSGPGRLGSKLSFDAIRRSVRNSGRNVESSGSGGKGVDPQSFTAFTKNLRMKPSDSTGSQTSSTVIGGTGSLPESIFGKEMREKEEGEFSEEEKLEFVKTYRHEELGDRLRKLRPEAKAEDWFSLGELNDRLKKFREMEENEIREGSYKGVTAKDVRDVLIRMKVADDTKKNLCE